MSVSKGKPAGTASGVVGGWAPLDSGLLVPIAYLPVGVGASQVAAGNHVHAAPMPRQVAPTTAFSAASAAGTFPLTPLATSLFFACFVGVVSDSHIVSSIAQTNVTWTLLRRTRQSTNVTLELWKGVPSGVPGTVATATLDGTTPAGQILFTEWAGTGLAGTVDQAADTSSASATTQRTGTIVPSSATNLTFVMFGVANGGVELIIKSPYPFTDYAVEGANWGAIGWLWGSTASLIAMITNQSSAACASTIISVI